MMPVLLFFLFFFFCFFVFFKADEHPTYCYDLHATALRLLGIDHTKLSIYNNGIQRRLTDVHGHVIDSILG
jgi:hypothetical protein